MMPTLMTENRTTVKTEDATNACKTTTENIIIVMLMNASYAHVGKTKINQDRSQQGTLSSNNYISLDIGAATGE